MDDATSAYDKAAEEYARTRIGTEDIAELSKVRSLLPAGAHILDAGCAAGRDTRILHDWGLHATGIDLSKNLIAIARRHNPDIEFKIADMRELPFRNGTFDAVWASAVLHHVGKAEMPTVLREFCRILIVGGLLYVHTKGGKGELQTREATVAGGARTFELVTPEELDSMLVEAGLKKVSLTVKPSRTRQGLLWVNALYKKPASRNGD